MTIGLWQCKPPKPIVAPANDGHPLAKLTDSEKAIYWKNRDKAIELRFFYKKYMTFRDDQNKFSSDISDKFLALFEDNAKVWNDLLLDPYPVSPVDYVSFVRNFLPNGVNASMEFDQRSESQIENPKYFRYYRVGKGENEYYMHLLIIKKMYLGLNGDNPKKLIQEQRDLNLEMVFHFDEEKNTAKICEIKPISN